MVSRIKAKPSPKHDFHLAARAVSGSQLDLGLPNPEERQDFLSVERSWCKSKSQGLVIGIEESHLSLVVIQRDSDSPWPPIQRLNCFEGGEGLKPVPTDANSPNPLGRVKADPTLSPSRVSGHPHSPKSPIPQLHFPVVPPRREAFVAQHRAVGVKSLRVVRQILGCFIPSHAPPVLGEDKVGVCCVWIQSHVCYKDRMNEGRKTVCQKER